MQTEQKKVVTQSDRRDLRRQVLNMLCCSSLYAFQLISLYRMHLQRLLYITGFSLRHCPRVYGSMLLSGHVAQARFCAALILLLNMYV